MKLLAAPAADSSPRRGRDCSLPLAALLLLSPLQTRALSLEEKVGQLFLVALDTEIASRYEPYIREGKIGAGLLRWDRFTGEEARAFSARMQEWASSAPSETPFLLAADHEGGPVFTQRLYGGTVFPGNMALGAAGEPALARKAAEAAAKELRALGIHADFAPVLDVNSNPDNPIIGVRSFGEDPEAVSRLGLAALEGYRRGGVLPVVKHFPGHGDTAEDSHLGLPRIARPLDDLLKTDLVPFKAAIAAQAPALMPAHIVFPAVGAAEGPVTLSSAALTDFLRNRLGYGGVVFSDSLDMGAIVNSTGAAEAAVMAFEAGCDVLITGKADFPPIYERMLAAVQSGRVPEERLERSVGRILRLKSELGLFADKPRLPSPSVVGKAGHRRLALKIAERAVTLVRNQDKLLPLFPADPRRFLVVLSRSNRFSGETQRFFEQLRRRHPASELVELSPAPDEASAARALERAQTADLLLLGTFAWGPSEFKPQTELLRRLLALGKPAIVASLMNPYDLRYYPEAGTALAVYGLTDASLEAAAELLFGEIKPRGRLPVSVPGFAGRGTGL